MNKKVLLIVSILVLIGIFRFSENTADFSTYNPGWNGGTLIKKFASENHQTIAVPDRLDVVSFEPDKTALVVLGHRDNFSERDTEIIKKFVREGGLLILGDDFGSGNELLSRFTASVYFSKMLLMDDMVFWKNSTFPVATTHIENVSNITMNYATFLVITDNSINVLARTSNSSWASKDGFTRERSGSFPIIADIPFEHGKIIAIADPSIFINSMLPFEDNKLLFEKLVENRTFVIFDEIQRTPPAAAIHYLLKSNLYIQYLFAAVVVSVAILYMKKEKLSTFRKKKTNIVSDKLEEENIISDLLKRHKWDKDKLMLFRSRLKGRSK